VESQGKVIAILNSAQLLIQLNAEASGALTGLPGKVSPDHIFVVFGRYEKEELKAQGVPHLDFPKGQIKIAARQTEDVFLAERFKLPDEKSVASYQERGLFASLITGLDRFSAEFDQSESLNFSPENAIRVGDHVGER
jgi:hypothetical protein